MQTITFWLLLALAAPAGAIVGGTPTTAFGQVASGVQIAPNWVLTARHVGLHTGGTFANGYGSSLIAARYEAGSGTQLSDDLALLRLATPIAAPQLTLNASLLAPGEGYDIAGTIVTGANQVPRGYGFTSIRAVWDLADVDDAGPGGPVAVNYLVTGLGLPYVEGGDSGGALFVGRVTTATAPLWGITSARIDEGSQHGSAFVQLASYRAWIDATLLADPADGQLALWVATSVPEVRPAALLALGLLGLAWLRRRRP